MVSPYRRCGSCGYTETHCICTLEDAEAYIALLEAMDAIVVVPRLLYLEDPAKSPEKQATKFLQDIADEHEDWER